MFEEIVQRNKDFIKEDDESKKDEIMDLHLDLRLKNTASAKITEKMQSMRQQARKIAYDFLWVSEMISLGWIVVIIVIWM